MNVKQERRIRERIQILVKEMLANPQYIAADDDLTTISGVIDTAIAFIGRMTDDVGSQSQDTTRTKLEREAFLREHDV